MPVQVKRQLSDEQRIKKLLDYAHLGLDDPSEISIANDLTKQWTEEEKNNPVKKIVRLMRKPEYIAWTVKVLFNIELLPLQVTVLWEMWNHPFPMLICNRGFGKSFLLAIYGMLKALLCQGSKVVIVGAAFRQAKVIFEYCETVWNNAPVLRDIVGGYDRAGPRRDIDRCTMVLGESVLIAIPLGDGTKIRGLRANVIIADEFASIPQDVFETVVAGFGVVSHNPVENVKRRARMKLLKNRGHDTKALEDDGHRSNQTILSGTAYYDFNHFATYWKRWKAFIESRGDLKKLAETLGGPDKIDPNFNWKDYCVIRIPVELLNEGFMDEKHVARSRATVHSGIYLMEFGACFAKDSNGFFSRKLIEGCVVGHQNRPIEIPSYGEISFIATLRGNPHRQYIMGVDPASESDRFSIVIVECYDNHRRIVYCWTTTRADHRNRVKLGLAKTQDFYGYCARKIRELQKAFTIQHISMDSQGGGVAVMEALHDPDKMLEGEVPIWPVVDDEKPADTDNMAGLHILEMVNFAKAEWVVQSNHGMRKDFEDKALLFPHFDPMSIMVAAQEDINAGRVKRSENGDFIPLYDTLEDVVLEIEELKDELATIVHTQTANGRDHWDTPEVKLPGGKKGRLRKDRYSALLMANMAARSKMRAPPSPAYKPVGGFAKNIAGAMNRTVGPQGGLYHMGPEWANRDSAGFGTVVRRGGG